MEFCYYDGRVHVYETEPFCYGIYCVKCRRVYEVHPFKNVLTCFLHPSYEELERSCTTTYSRTAQKT